MGIRKFNISIDKYIEFSWIADVALRLPNILKLFKTLFTGPKTIEAEYRAWRDGIYIKAKVTGELMSIEWYLNYLFDPHLKQIYIRNNAPSPVNMGIRDTEPTLFKNMGIRGTEPTLKQVLSLPKEDAVLGQNSFGVFIPASIASRSDDITQIVNQFRFANKTFTIITF